MCGIIGYYSVDTSNFMAEKKHRAFFAEGLYVDALRGMDGTGMFIKYAHKGKTTERIYKRALASHDFLNSPAAKALLDINDTKVAIGHNRFSTMKGLSSSDDNAHPFKHGNITLVHNGTCSNFLQAASAKDFEVDSDWVTWLIATKGLDEAMNIAKGAFSLVWHDSSDGSINFYRNSDRPLHFAATADKTTLLYASEKGTIEWLAGRNHIPLLEQSGGKETSTIWQTQPMYHLKFTDSVLKYESHKVEIIVAPTTPYVPFSPPARTPIGSTHSNTYAASLDILKELGYMAGQRINFMLTSAKGPNNKFAGVAEIEYRCAGQEPHVRSVDVESWPQHNQYEVYAKSKMLLNGRIGSASTDLHGDITLHIHDLTETVITAKDYDTMNIISVPIVELERLKWKDAVPLVTGPEPKELPNKRHILGPRGKMLTTKQFERKVRYGCSQCQVDIFLIDANKLEWLDNGGVLCPGCASAFNRAFSLNGGN